MKKVVALFVSLFGLMLVTSCGSELPDGWDNIEVKKDDGKQNPTPENNGTPSENDNPLPTY